MASIYKPAGRNKYRIEYRDASGQIKIVAGYRDKQATQAKAKELERNAERERAGLPVAAQEKRREPIENLTAAYLADLLRLGRSQEHHKSRARLLRQIWAHTQWQSLSQVRPDTFNVMLADLHRRGLSPRTVNFYRSALYAFLAYCVRQTWLEDNPMKNVPAAASRKVRQRRAYTADEFARLCQHSRNYGTLYRIAGLSGFRWSELARMEKQDLTPMGDNPCWHPRPEIVKGRRREITPILPEILPYVLALWQSLPSERSQLFPRMPIYTTVNNDIDRAGIAKHDSRGRVVDFHSLRYFFCTHLATYLKIQTVCRLMRHKDVRMTSAVYMDLGILEIADQIDAIPPALPLTEKPQKTLAILAIA